MVHGVWCVVYGVVREVLFLDQLARHLCGVEKEFGVWDLGLRVSVSVSEFGSRVSGCMVRERERVL